LRLSIRSLKPGIRPAKPSRWRSGTGYGSFIYLKKLPITSLKIDIEFVRDLVTNPANLHVVKAIVSLARAFGLQTVAEGIEDEQTLTILKAEGVDFGQGYHLGRPAPLRGARTPRGRASLVSEPQYRIEGR
jgi:EAL domain-containing protein (putative c-di-GMP-specific phosphodiesterase class I)